VSSNQLRGRVLRVCPGDPDKAAHIWHLACIEEGEAGEIDAPAPDSDLDLLRRRFRVFLGPPLDVPAGAAVVLGTGLERLGLDVAQIAAADASALNARMRRLASDRFRLDALWRDALVPPDAAPARRLAHEVLFPEPRMPRGLIIDWLPALGGWGARVRQWFLERRLRAMACAVQEALVNARCLPGHEPPVSVVISAGPDCIRACLRGASRAADRIFADSLRQVLDPLARPRWLLRRGGDTWFVPDALDDNRADAQALSDAWRRHVGRNRLVFTGSAEGRRLLLRARARLLAQRHLPPVGLSTVWR
jgi:hypothetical protein